jgi:hypothetical protein
MSWTSMTDSSTTTPASAIAATIASMLPPVSAASFVTIPALGAGVLELDFAFVFGLNPSFATIRPASPVMLNVPIAASVCVLTKSAPNRTMALTTVHTTTEMNTHAL